MTAMELLEVMGDIHGSYIQEAHENRRRLPKGRLLFIAAIVAVMLLLAGCVAILLGLEDLSIGQRTYPDKTGANDLISLQGYSGSGGYMAQKEWLEFQEAYDTDQTLLHLSPYDGYVVPDEFRLYNCYTPEMVDEVERLCTKYGLERITRLYINWEAEDMFSALGIPGIFRSSPQAEPFLYGGYFTQDGSFNISGYLDLSDEGSAWSGPVDFQYLCARRGTFLDGFYMGLGDIGSYEQWHYTTGSGIDILLAMNTERALILADREECFISVNIMSLGTGDSLSGERPMSREVLEHVAELFDLSQVPCPVDVDLADERQAQLEAARQLQIDRGEQERRRESYEEYIRDFRNDPQGGYALLDLDRDGDEELCYSYLGRLMELYTMSGGYVKGFETYAFYEGYKLYGTEEEGLVLGSTRQEGQQTYFLFLEVDGEVLRFRELLKLDPVADPIAPWFRCSNCLGMEYMDFMDGPMYWMSLSQEEYGAVWEKYPTYIPDTVPVSHMLLTASGLFDFYREQYPGEGLWLFQEDYDGDGLPDLAVFYQGAFRAMHRLGETGAPVWDWKPREGFLMYETGVYRGQPSAYEVYLPGMSFTEDRVEYQVFLRVREDGLYIRDCLRFVPDVGEWYVAESPESNGILWEDEATVHKLQWKKISAEEYQDILDGYTEMVYELA